MGVKAYAELPAVELPYGRKRALEIATTLALDPEVLLLDEPMAGMGAEDIKRTSALIRRVAKDRTVLMVEHNLSVVADLSDRHHGAGARRDPGRGHLRGGLQEPAGDRSLHGDGRGGAMAEAQLAVRDLHGWYGESHILHGMSFDVKAGEVVTLLGRNGAGKTTTMRAIMGMMRQAQGLRALRGQGADPAQVRPHRPAAASPTARRSAASSPASTCART